VTAADIDPEAVVVTRRNARRNRAGRLVRALCADSYAAPGIAARAPYDLIACNILARPLRRMAKDLARCLAPGGVAVLSGFLETDANAVLAAHRLQGLRLIRRITIDGWQTLIVGRMQNDCTHRCDTAPSQSLEETYTRGRLKVSRRGS
jgi:ribosomal protein L11 methyltransferase